MTFKFVHVACVVASYLLFFLRGIWIWRNAPIMQRRWVKAVPHMVDTLLLASAICLAFGMRLSPLAAPWLAAKIVALMAYIGLGSLAFKQDVMPAARLVAWGMAQAVFFYIVLVAMTHVPEPWRQAL